MQRLRSGGLKSGDLLGALVYPGIDVLRVVKISRLSPKPACLLHRACLALQQGVAAKGVREVEPDCALAGAVGFENLGI